MEKISCEAVWSSAFVCWKISDYSFNFCALMSLLRFLFLHGSVLESCTFLRICLFLPSCPFYWHIIADSSLLGSFVFFCVVCCDLSIFVSNFVDLIFLPLFLDESASKFGKLNSGHRTGKGQFSFQSQRKAMPKYAQTTAQLHSSHTLVK